ncbi:RCC1 domain-containing protein 1 [Trichomycterus rosablanca]|uniref:RCC1 domain-containing protein 1 n=1 Tax=Trichomycterus rosablanca TaxID=2290929 RepID=UPI002F352770
MNWFGFGFNGFGQINPQLEDGTITDKVVIPVVLDTLCHCKKADPSVNIQTETQGVKVGASWSRRVVFHTSGEGRVCLSGFVNNSVNSEEYHVLVPESKGCEDVLISERYLTLKFAHKVECWSLKKNERTLAWTGTLDATENLGEIVRLPMVAGGYIAFKPPFFRPLSPHLKAVNLALGTEHAVLLTATGTVYTWGSGSHGQLGHGNLVSEDEPQAVEALWGVPVKSVTAGGWHSASISAGGDLYVWGWNESGQIGLPSKGFREDFQKRHSTGKDEMTTNKAEDINDVFISIQALPALLDVSESAEIIKVSCGSRHTTAITSTGDLYTWGWGQYGQLGHGSECSSDEPKVVEYFISSGLRVEDVVCGLWNTFVSAVPRNYVSSP